MFWLIIWFYLFRCDCSVIFAGFCRPQKVEAALFDKPSFHCLWFLTRVLCNNVGIAAAENWKFSFNGYSDKTCKIKSSGKVLTFPLDTCTKNVYGQMSIFTCQKPGVILEKMYTDDNCTKIERDFSIENNGVRAHLLS